jgi:hypothetical protein
VGDPKVAPSLRRRLGVTGAALVAYLGVAVLVLWDIWSTHPSATTTCACGDTSLFLWFLEWPAYAIAHGHNPFFSTAMFHPTGVDVLSNTSVLLIGTVLSPVTWLFGPVATLNVALTLGPALTALAMFWLLRRWVAWTPAAFAGGLIFGFSPFAFVSYAGGHLMTGVLVFVPLIVGSLDELLVRQVRRPVRTGILLGALGAAQFFVSTEVLVIVIIAALAGVVVLVVATVVSDREALISRIPHAARGLVAATIAGVALLGYPVWVAVDGPAHLSGLVWPTLQTGTGGIMLPNLWSIRFMSGLRAVMQVVGGYEGPSLPQGEYLGTGLLVVIGTGLALWRRDRRLWFLTATGVIGAVLSLGINKSHWVPWNVLAHVPVVQNIIPARFMIVTTLCAAGAVAIVTDRAHGSLVVGLRRLAGAGRSRFARVGIPVLSATVAAGIAAVAVVPLASAEATNVPLTAQPEHLPAWFSDAGTKLGSGQVVFAMPAPFTLYESVMAWQAIDLLRYSIAGGGGPEGIPARAGSERKGFEVLSAASFALGGPPKATQSNVSAVRAALAGWGVTIVVYPDPSTLPAYDHGTSPAVALGLLTLAIGRTPQFVDDAWVWSDVRTPGPQLYVSPSGFEHCTQSGTAAGPVLSTVPACVAATASPDT